LSGAEELAEVTQIDIDASNMKSNKSKIVNNVPNIEDL
jgi:hypothetical protein